jgi:hypothetical protein
LIYLIVILAGGNLGTTGPATDSDEGPLVVENVISLNALSLPVLAAMQGIQGDIGVEYQRSINSFIGFTIDIEFLYRVARTADIQNEDYEVKGWGFLLGPRFFFSGNGFSGFYGSVLAGYAWTSGDAMYLREFEEEVFSTSFELGYSRFWQNGFVLNIGLGANLRWMRSDEKYIVDQVVLTPRCVIGLGYGW